MNKNQHNETRQCPEIVQKLFARYFHLLAKSCKRYGTLKESSAPDILVDMEKVLIRRRFLFLFNIDSDGRN